jgi:chromosome partitioning protein
MITVSFVNQKSKAGKTTLVVNLAAAIDKICRGSRCRQLIVDVDPQARATDIMLDLFDINKPNISRLFDNETYDKFGLIYKTRFDSIDIIPSSIELSMKEFYCANILNWHLRLKDYLQKVEDNYDLCFIDCPSALSPLILSALTASDYVFIPAVPNRYSVLGIEDLFQSISFFKELNPEIKILGIVPSIVDKRYKMHNDILVEFKRKFLEFFLDDLTISTNATLKSATTLKKTLFEHKYDPKAHKSIMKLAKWILGVTDVYQKGLAVLNNEE